LKYNYRFAGRNYATDVLSFPVDDETKELDRYLGDILVSVPMADRQKTGSLQDELRVLALHGLLHLLGYDHESDGGEMLALESRIREEFGLR
jgi:probable rRNA maturation factor